MSEPTTAEGREREAYDAGRLAGYEDALRDYAIERANRAAIEAAAAEAERARIRARVEAVLQCPNCPSGTVHGANDSAVLAAIEDV